MANEFGIIFSDYIPYIMFEDFLSKKFVGLLDSITVEFVILTFANT